MRNFLIMFLILLVISCTSTEQKDVSREYASTNSNIYTHAYEYAKAELDYEENEARNYAGTYSWMYNYMIEETNASEDLAEDYSAFYAREYVSAKAEVGYE